MLLDFAMFDFMREDSTDFEKKSLRKILNSGLSSSSSGICGGSFFQSF
jgi:hypothetical protein